MNEFLVLLSYFIQGGDNMYEINCYDSYGNTIDYLTQWDYNRKITMYIDNYDLSYAPEVHFCNQKSEEALVVQSVVDGNKIIADIPNILLQEHLTLCAYVYLSDVNNASSQKTILSVNIPVRYRPKPSEYTYIENISKITAAQIEESVFNKLKDNLLMIKTAEQTVKSVESSGINVYTITLTDGTVSNFEIRNGSDANVTSENIKNALGYTPANDENYVKTINGVAPDENGNVVVSVSGGSTEICPYEEVNSIEEMTDITKQYLMNGYVYSYKATSGVAVPNFTNHANPNDANWITGKRINSSGNVVDDNATSLIISNYIPATDSDIVRVKGIDFHGDAKGQAKIAYYNNEGDSTANGNFSPYTKSSPIIVVEEGITSHEIGSISTTTDYSHIHYIRVSGELTGNADDVIITVNEEITYRMTDGTYEWIKGEKWVSSNSSTNSGTTTEEETIPTWWEDEIADTIAKIKALQVGANTVTFPFFSDNHQRNGYAGVLIKKIMDECNIPYCFYGGDSISSAGNMTEEIMIEQDKKFDSMMKVIPNGRFCRAVGNHDGYWLDSSSTKHWYSRSQIYDLFLREESIAQSKRFGMDGTYYYIDEIASKIRFIILNTEGTNGAGAIDAVQLEWLKNVALKFEEGGYSVVFISHRPISNHYHAMISNAQEVIAVVNDYINGNDEHKADVVGWFSGHIHRDRIYTGIATNTSDDTVGEVLPFTQITIISDHTEIGYGGVSHAIDDSDQSHAIDFVTINKDTKEVNITRLGFGEDRNFTYTQSPAPYTLIPETTVDFSEEQWDEMGGYVQESTFMFDTTKSYKVVWDGVEYVVDEVHEISDEVGTLYVIGNGSAFELEDNGLPFVMATAEMDGAKLFQAMNWAYNIGNASSPTATFSVMEIVEEDLPIYKCTLEDTLISLNGYEGTFQLLKGISINKLKAKQRIIELDGKLYTSEYFSFENGGTTYHEVLLIRTFSEDSSLNLWRLRKETIHFRYTGKVNELDCLYKINKYISESTWTLVSSENE